MTLPFLRGLIFNFQENKMWLLFHPLTLFVIAVIICVIVLINSAIRASKKTGEISNKNEVKWNKSPSFYLVIASVIVSTLTLPLFWLILPIIIFPLGGLILAGMSINHASNLPSAYSFKMKFVSIIAMFYAVGVFLLVLYIVNTTYRA